MRLTDPFPLSLLLGSLIVLMGSPERVSGEETTADEVVDLPAFSVAPAPSASVPEAIVGDITTIEVANWVDLGYTELTEVLQAVGIPIRSFTGNGAQASVDLRGYGENSHLRTLVLVDGQKLNRVDMASVNWLEVPLSQIASVQILRGSQSARYGNHALGGVILIQTKRGRESRGGEAGVSVSTFPEAADETVGWQAHAASWGSQGRLAASAALQISRDDGWRENNRSESENLRLTADIDLGERFDVENTLSYSQVFLEFPGPLTTEDYLDNPRQSESDRTIAQLRADSDRETIRIRSSFLWASKNAGFTGEAPLSFHQTETVSLFQGRFTTGRLRDFAVEPRIQFSNTDWFAEVGLGGFYETLRFRQTIDPDFTITFANAALDRQAFTAWFVAERSTEWGDFSVGVRTEMIELDIDVNEPFRSVSDTVEETGTAAQIGWQREIAEGRTVFARLDRVYRFPTTDEFAFYQGFQSEQLVNPDLGAETGWNFDLGWQEALGDRGRLQVTTFFQRLEDTIAFLRGLNRNIGATERYGLDLSFDYQLRDDLELTGSWQWIAADYRGTLVIEEPSGPTEIDLQGREVYLVPRHRLNLGLNWQATERFSLAVQARYRDEQWQGNDFFNELDRIEAATVADLSARWQLNGKLKLTLAILNLFDEDYPALRYSDDWYPAPARMVRFLTQFEF